MSKKALTIRCALSIVIWLCFANAPIAQTAQYALPKPHPEFTFPRDHGSHPEFKIEWWYFVGHIHADDDTQYGFQATFFRNATRPHEPGPTNTFDNGHIYLAHMALTDIDANRYYYEERINREGWDAFSSTETLDLRNGNWSLKVETGPNSEERFVLKGSIQADIQFSFELVPQKPRTLFGEDGVSLKGADPSATSHYISYTRLALRGTLTQNGKTKNVNGSSWMDHEFSSNQLSSGLSGWDWICIQLNDGREIKAYRLRDEAGGISPYSRLIWIDGEGMPTEFKTDAFRWNVKSTWKSKATAGEYPTRFEIETQDPQTGKYLKLKVSPKVEAQELVGDIGGIDYWEGACFVESVNNELSGNAYLELTGYSESLNGKL